MALQRAKAFARTKNTRYLVLGLVFLLLLITCLYTLDPDFGWHLSAGQYTLAHGIPATDIYTYTAANFPWIQHEWFADVVNATLYHYGGFTLLAVVYSIVWTASLWLMVKKLTWKSGLVVLVTAIALAQFVAIRDTAWTLLFLVLIHRMFNRFRNYIPLLFVVWANMHGGFVVGFVYLGWRILYDKQWRSAWIVPAAIMASFINPYGIGLYREILSTLLDPTLHTKIQEWQSWAIGGSLIIVPLLWFISLVPDIRHRRWKNLLQFDTLLFAASLLSIRHYMLFATFALPRMVTFYQGFTLKNWRPNLRQDNIRHIVRIFAVESVILAAGILVLWSTIVALQGPLQQFSAKDSLPTAAINSLRATPCQGNIFNDYNIGGYLIWKYPEQKVYIDGRMPSWQLNGTNYMDNYLRIFTDPHFQRQQFRQYHIACAIVLQSSSLTKSLVGQGWQATTDPHSNWVLLRKNSAFAQKRPL